MACSLSSVEQMCQQAAYEEIYRLKKVNDSTDEPDKNEETPELLELRRFAATIRTGGSELERRAEEMTRRLVNEQIERIRLSRSNTALRRRSARAEQLMRRARDRMVVVETQAGKRCAQLQYQLDTALIDLAECQGQLVRSVPIEKYEKLALRYKKECVAEVLGSELDEVWKENVVTIAAPTDAKMDELEAKNSYLKKIVEVLSEQNDFWSKETEILQNENEELKRFVEDMENESDLKNILASIEQRLLETIREQQEGRRDHEREFRKAREAEESLAKGRREWTAERTRLVYAIKTLQTALSTAQMNSLNALSLPQIEKLKAKIREVRENELEVDETKSKQDATPAHRAKLAREWCRRQLPDFTGEEEWSSYFPELDSLESHEWSLIRRGPVEFAVPVWSPRMQKLEDGWEEMEKDPCVPHAIKSKAILTSIRAHGGYFGMRL
nr:Hypothetical protein CBG14942 [Haemonchus contortus]